MYHIAGFLIGLGLVTFGIYVNTKTQTHLRKNMLKKYIIIYLIMVIMANFIIIPIFSLLKN